MAEKQVRGDQVVDDDGHDTAGSVSDDDTDHQLHHVSSTMETMDREQLKIVLRKLSRNKPTSDSRRPHALDGGATRRDSKYAYRGSCAEANVGAIGVLTSGGDCCGN